MAIVYQVFSNGGTGGPVDYSAPIATVSGTSFTTGALAAPGDYRFAVRAKDTVTGLSEANTGASVRLVLDAAGNEVGRVPNRPFALVARPTTGGGCSVAWSYISAGQAAPPASFSVYLAPATGSAPTAPAASVAYRPGTSAYSCRLAGLADGAAYTVSVVAVTAAGLAGAAASAAVVGDSTPPGDVESLAASAIA